MRLEKIMDQGTKLIPDFLAGENYQKMSKLDKNQLKVKRLTQIFGIDQRNAYWALNRNLEMLGKYTTFSKNFKRETVNYVLTKFNKKYKEFYQSQSYTKNDLFKILLEAKVIKKSKNDKRNLDLLLESSFADSTDNSFIFKKVDENRYKFTLVKNSSLYKN